MLPLFSPPNDVWERSTEIPCWWHITTQIWVVLLIGWIKFPMRLDQSKALPRLGSDASSVWNFYACFPDIIWQLFCQASSVVGHWLISETWQILRVLKQTEEEGTAFALQMARTLYGSDDHIEIMVPSSWSMRLRVQYCLKVNHQSPLLSHETSVLSWELIVSLFTMLKSEIVYPV